MNLTMILLYMCVQDLLFSACGLSILSTIICTLSTVTCSIHIFSLDLLHLVRQNAQHLYTETLGLLIV